jgi:hypothetical protein
MIVEPTHLPVAIWKEWRQGDRPKPNSFTKSNPSGDIMSKKLTCLSDNSHNKCHIHKNGMMVGFFFFFLVDNDNFIENKKYIYIYIYKQKTDYGEQTYLYPQQRLMKRQKRWDGIFNPNKKRDLRGHQLYH